MNSTESINILKSCIKGLNNMSEEEFQKVKVDRRIDDEKYLNKSYFQEGVELILPGTAECETELNSIGKVIQNIRENIGMTREQLGNKVGLDRHEIIKIEKSQRALSLEESINISQAFSVGVNDLYTCIKDTTDKDTFFVKAFRDKQMDEKELLEIKKIDLLMGALQTQQEIFIKQK